MRIEKVTVNEKLIEIREKRNKELEAMIQGLKNELVEVELGTNLYSMLFGMQQFIRQKLLSFFPDLTQDDLDNAYPSEIEALIEGFVNVNFMGLRRTVSALMLVTKQLLSAASTIKK